MLDLSTAHVPNLVSPDFGDLRYVEHAHGWIVFVSTSTEDRFPAWLRPIIKHAIAHECILINFDSDAEVVSSFKTYGASDDQ